MKIKIENEKGFSLIELLVSIAIFALMTAVLMAKYGNFNQGILLTNLAYDVALTVRNAQSYGLNVRSSSRLSNDFNSPYGVHFTASSTSFVFYADTDKSGDFSPTLDFTISSTTIKRGSQVGYICLGSGSGSCVSAASADVTFTRPDPNAHFRGKDSGGVDVYGTPTYAEVRLTSTDGSIKKVVMRSTGQISVED